MEVRTDKRLLKHAAPVVILAAALVALPVITLSRYNTGSQPAELALARALVTRVVYMKPAPHGLAKLTLGNPAAPVSNAGTSLQTGPADTGSTAQLLLGL